MVCHCASKKNALIIDLNSIEQHIENNFLILPMKNQKINYQTPNGDFSIKVKTTDKKIYEILFVSEQQYYLHEMVDSYPKLKQLLSCYFTRGNANFCKSRMIIKGSPPFEIRSKIDAVAKVFNQRYSPGVTFHTAPLNNLFNVSQYFGFIDDQGKRHTSTIKIVDKTEIKKM